MKKGIISQEFGRQAFGLDPEGYHSARPPYPEWVYEAMCKQCGDLTGASAFEIGAGTGIATRRLLDLGVNPLTAIEPDTRLATFLRHMISDNALTIIPSIFEDAVLPEESFDLGFCATAFHWLNENTALEKIASLLRPGGYWVAVWNVFGDPNRFDAFHEATKLLLNGPSSPSNGAANLPFAMDAEARIEALNQSGAFDDITYQTSAWSLELNAEQIAALYATYSNINARPDRKAVIAELTHIAKTQFNNRVTRNMVTCIYMARRRFW